jgi:hypothetical protein
VPLALCVRLRRFGHHQPAPHHYELYVFRDSLVPKSYSPAAMRRK